MGVDIPVLILDVGLPSPAIHAEGCYMLNLIPSDLGRPFGNIASNLDVSDWKGLFGEVTGRRRSVEREVSDPNGHRYSMRLQPFRVEGDQVEGVLIVILDTDLIYRQRDEALASANLAARNWPGRSRPARFKRMHPSVRCRRERGPEHRIATGNIEKTFGYGAEELIGRPLEIVIPENPRTVRRAPARLLSERTKPRHGDRTRLEAHRKDGTNLPVRYALSVIEHAGRRYRRRFWQQYHGAAADAGPAEAARTRAGHGSQSHPRRNLAGSITTCVMYTQTREWRRNGISAEIVSARRRESWGSPSQ